MNPESCSNVHKGSECVSNYIPFKQAQRVDRGDAKQHTIYFENHYL